VEVTTFSEKMRTSVWKSAGWKIHPKWTELKSARGLEAVAADLAVVVLNQKNPAPFVAIDIKVHSKISGLKYVGVGRIEGDKRDGKPRRSENLSAEFHAKGGVGGAWVSRGSSILCQGDSGGPLLSEKGELVGIASGVGVPEGAPDSCGVGEVVYHADVRTNINWMACTFRGWGVALPGFEQPDCR